MTSIAKSAVTLALVSLALAGCGTGPSGAASPTDGIAVTGTTGSGTPSAVTVTVTPTPTPTGPDPALRTTLALDRRMVAFATPSGHSVCQLGRGIGDGKERLFCMVEQPTWQPPPPKPARCEHVTYAASLEIADGVARYGCTGGEQLSPAIYTTDPQAVYRFDWFRPGTDQLVGTAYSGSGKAATLAYGRSIRYGVHECTSTQAGARCTHTGTGHGFLISTDKTEVF